MKFPHTIRFRTLTATIYGKSAAYPFYRMAVRVAGKRVVRSFQTFTDAKREAEAKLRQTATGNLSAGLSAKESADAITIRQALAVYRQETGRRLSALEAVSSYIAAAKLLPDNCTLKDALDGFLSTVATIKRMDLNAAVEQFIESRKIKTVAKDGRRPQLSPGWHYIVAMWLREFAKSFPGHAVCDLTREHLTAYVNGHGDVSPRTRNGRRNAVKMFLKWAVERDYLAANHRLLVADGMTKEVEDFGEIEFYTPKELRALLEASQRAKFRSLLPVVALGGLAGLRLQEIARLTWADVWRVPEHIEIAATKAKTRQRRLVEICSALAAWLQPYCGLSGPVWAGTAERANTLDNFHHLFAEMLDELGVPKRQNGLRHAFCSYHFALHANENLTAQQAGNSPAMIHAHYKGLATKAEAEKWFAVRPAKAAKISSVCPRSQR